MTLAMMTSTGDMGKASTKHLLFDLAIGTGLFLLAISIYSCNLMHDLYVDELYHLLPAHSLLHHGTFDVGAGEYLRSSLYTRFIAFQFGLFGETIEVARLSSAVIGALFISIIYLTMKWLLGRKEALVVALVLMVLPSSIYLAQFIRFYALHQLAFYLGVIGTYAIITNKLPVLRQIALTALTLGLFGLAYKMQVTTLIGMAAAWLWALVYLMYQSLDESRRTVREVGLLIFLVLISAVMVIALMLSGKLAGLIADYRHAEFMNADNVDNYLFYHRFLRSQYPALWTFFPIACLVAIGKKPAPAFFLVAIFIIGLTLLSFGGMKDERYVMFLYPFFIGIWAIFSLSMFSTLKRSIKEWFRARPSFPCGRIAISPVVNVILIVLFASIFLNNPAIPISFHMLNGKEFRHEIGDWSLSKAQVQSKISDANVVLTTNDVETLYYFGHYDFNFSRFVLGEAANAEVGSSNLVEEFTIDPRTGLPVLSKTASLELILNCYSSGVFLGDARKWYKEGRGLGSEGVRLISDYAEQLETAPLSRLVVFTWKSDKLLPEKECALPYRFKPNRVAGQ